MTFYSTGPRRWALAMVAMLTIASLQAHEIRPTIVDLVIDNNGVYQLQLETNLEALIAGIGPEHSDTEEAPEAVHYNALRALSPEDLQQELDAFMPELLAGFRLEADGQSLSPIWRGAEIPEVGDTTLSRDSRLLFEGQLPLGIEQLGWQWSNDFGANAMRVSGPGNSDLYTGYLTQGQSTGPIDMAGVIGGGWPVWLWFIPVLILGPLWLMVTLRSRKAD